MLGKHLRKVHGYIVPTFAAGRPATNGNNTSAHAINSKFRKANNERVANLELKWPHATKIKTTILGLDTYAIKLDISQTGSKFIAGDICEIYPENPTIVVKELLQEFKLNNFEIANLNEEWLNYLTIGFGLEKNLTTIPLEEILKHAHLKPITTTMLYELYKLTENEYIKTILNNFEKPNYTLLQLLKVLNEHQGNATAIKTILDYFCNFFEPLHYRYYSVTPTENPNVIQLTVSAIKQQTNNNNNNSAVGVASNYLCDCAVDTKIPIRRATGHTFHLTEETQGPVIMFAGGNGISPLLGFIQELARNKVEGHLYYSVSSENHYYHKAEIERICSENSKLNLLNLITDQNKPYLTKITDKKVEMNLPEKVYIDKLDSLNLPDEALTEGKQLHDLIKKDGGVIYVCGAHNFGESMKKLLINIISRYEEKSPAEAEKTIYQWLSNGHLVLDTFYGKKPSDNIISIPFSQVAMHNNPKDGHWFVINDEIYDLEKFSNEHPGGSKTMFAYAGQDVSQAYKSIDHHKLPKIHNKLPAYFKGYLAKPQFHNEADQKLYETWKNLLSEIVGMENNLANNTTFCKEERKTMYLIDGVFNNFITGPFTHLIENGLPRIYTSCEFNNTYNQNEQIQRKDQLIQLAESIKKDHIDFMEELYRLTKINFISTIMRAKLYNAANETYIKIYMQLNMTTKNFLSALKKIIVTALQKLEHPQSISKAYKINLNEIMPELAKIFNAYNNNINKCYNKQALNIEKIILRYHLINHGKLTKLTLPNNNNAFLNHLAVNDQ